MIDLITGNKFKKICHYSYDEFGFIKHREPNGELLKIFVKIDFVKLFFEIWNEGEFVLVTHNGDTPIDSNFISELNNDNLIEWYGQNVNIYHPKLKSIPIGIANEIWKSGDEKIFLDIIKNNYQKDRMVYANFDVTTNPIERNKCIKEITRNGVNISDRKPFKKFLEEISKSYFIISPNGNGIDCHKIWESIYLKSVPIVTESINIKYYKDLPIYVLNDWSDFKINNLNENFYKDIWGDFDIEKLNIFKYIKK